MRYASSTPSGQRKAPRLPATGLVVLAELGERFRLVLVEPATIECHGTFPLLGGNALEHCGNECDNRTAHEDASSDVGPTGLENLTGLGVLVHD